MAKKKNKRKSESEPRPRKVRMEAPADIDADEPGEDIEDEQPDDDAQRQALRDAVEATRESANALREAANILTQSAAQQAAQQVAVSRWGQFPGQNMGIPPAAMMPMLPPVYYGERPPMMDGFDGYRYDRAASRRNSEMRESSGYSPKEPSDAKPSEEGRGKRWGSPIKSLKSRVNSTGHTEDESDAQKPSGSATKSSETTQSAESVVAGLPKFGEAPDPLPTPQEILASVPSLSSLGVSPVQPQPDMSQQPYPGTPYQPQGQMPSGMPLPVQPQAPDPYAPQQPYANQMGYAPDGMTTQVPPVQEQVIEVPAQDVVYGEVQIPDPYMQAYDPMQQAYDPAYGYDPARMYDPAQAAYYDQNQMYDPMQQAYDPYGYGYDPYADPAMFMEPPKAGKATVALILGILSILLAFIPPVGLVLAIVAVLLAKSYYKKGGTAPRAGTGRVCGIVGIVLSIVMAVAIGVFVAYFVGGLYGEANAGAIMGYLQTTPLAAFL